MDSLLKSAGLAALIHFWLASTSLVLYTLFFVVTWQFIGPANASQTMLTYLYFNSAGCAVGAPGSRSRPPTW